MADDLTDDEEAILETTQDPHTEELFQIALKIQRGEIRRTKNPWPDDSDPEPHD
jgi:hypothetical protein